MKSWHWRSNPLGQLLELEGTGGATIPYLGFVEVNLQIPGIQHYNEDVLLLVIPTMTYSQTVLVMVGSKIIDKTFSVMTKGELKKAATMWRQAHFGAVMSGLLQLSHTNSSKMGKEEEVSHSSPRSDPVEVQKFSLDDVKGPVHTTQKVIYYHHSAQSVCMPISVSKDTVCGFMYSRTDTRSPVANSSGINCDLWRITSWVLKGTYLPVQLECLHHGNTCKGCGWTGCPANKVPPIGHPPRTTKESHKKSPKGWVLEALDLQGLKEWPESEQKQARELLLKWEHLFVHSDLDLDTTALMKHKIQLTDWTPFKKHYQCIPPYI